MIPLLLFVSGKLTSSSCLVMIRKPLLVKIQKMLLYCFVGGALMCHVSGATFIFIYIYIYICIHTCLLFLNLVKILYMYVGSVCPHLKKRYHHLLEKVRRYIESVSEFDELISLQSLFLHFLRHEPSNFIQKNIETIKKSKHIDFANVMLPLGALPFLSSFFFLFLFLFLFLFKE